jgi:hypothetical protein
MTEESRTWSDGITEKESSPRVLYWMLNTRDGETLVWAKRLYIFQYPADKYSIYKVRPGAAFTSDTPPDWVNLYYERLGSFDTLDAAKAAYIVIASTL